MFKIILAAVQICIFFILLGFVARAWWALIQIGWLGFGLF